MTQPVLLIG